MGGQLTTGSSIYMASAGVPAADGAGLSSIKSFSQLLTSIAAMPLAGGTFTGNVLFTDNTYDIGASGATRPRTVYAGTSVITPLVNNATAALTLGNSTYGVTVPGAATFGNDVSISRSAPSSWPELKIENTYTLGDSNYAVLRIRTTGANGGDPLIILDNSGQFQWVMSVDNSDSDKFKIGPSINSTFFTLDSAGAATFSGDISMSKTSAQGYIYAYNTAGTRHVKMYQSGNHSYIANDLGNLYLQSGSAGVAVYTPGVDTNLFISNNNDSVYMTIGHQTIGVNTGNLTISAGGNLSLVPTGGTVAVTGAVTATTTMKCGTYTVATLPSAGSNAYCEACVSDSNAAASGNYGATVAGGGSNKVRVFSDGTNWVIA